MKSQTRLFTSLLFSLWGVALAFPAVSDNQSTMNIAAQSAERSTKSSSTTFVRLKKGAVLHESAQLAAYHACKPFAGDRAEVIGVQNGVSGLPVTLVKIKLINGQCKDVVGWVGQELLANAQ